MSMSKSFAMAVLFAAAVGAGSASALQVTDLRASSGAQGPGYAVMPLKWTSVGGTAYDLRYSNAPINAGNFAAATTVAVAAPKAAGGTEYVQVTLPVNYLTYSQTYYFALTVNGGPLSNVVSDGNKLISISGATLFKGFFQAAPSTNDFIDVDGNGTFGFNINNPPPYVQQLTPSYLAPLSSWYPYWAIQYRGVGSGTGLAELVNYYNKAPTTAELTTTFTIPADICTLNRTPWCSTAGVVAPGDISVPPTNPGACPIPPATIDIAIMDVPTTWFIKQSGTTAWNKKPLTAGYGSNSKTSVDQPSQGNGLKTLTGAVAPVNTLNLNSPADAQTVFDTPVAWVPIAFVASQGTGLTNVDMSELQYLYVTGRSKNGENFISATRDSGSGTRNAAMNSIGVDPSFGIGDNTAKKNSNGAVGNIGAAGSIVHQDCNLDGGGIMQAEVKNVRLAIGYVGLDAAGPDAVAHKVQILNVRKDIVTPAGTSYVRPLPDAVYHNTNINTGWQIGGAETMATVGNPLSDSVLPMTNKAAAMYIRNIKSSVGAWESPSGQGDPTNQNMPGQYLASRFFLMESLDAVPQSSPSVDPTKFVTNPALNADLQGGYSINVPADFDTTAGLVPIRGVPAAGTYNDGQTDKYIDSTSALLVAGAALDIRNKIAGDFNNDGKRDTNDIAAMMEACYNTVTLGTPWTFQPGTKVCVNILGDFNADGNFDAKDVRYFADGLAMDPVSRKLDRKAGFTAVDTAWATQPGGSSNFFGTIIAGVPGKTYQPGDSRADVAGNTAFPGARPMGNNGTVNWADVVYIKANFGSWSNLDQASTIDLSCDMNGDMVVDNKDVADVIRVVLGLTGDINLDGHCNVTDLVTLAGAFGAKTGDVNFNNLADLNGDGKCNVIDLLTLAGTFGVTLPGA